MIALVAASRPDFGLLLHIVGAAVFFGAIAVATVTQLASARVAEPDLLQRVAFRTLLIVGLPAYIVFRVGAEWLYSAGPYGDSDQDDPAWIGIGYIVGDIGAVLFLIALILAGIAVRKKKNWLVKTSGVITALILIALVIATWAMGAKPT